MRIELPFGETFIGAEFPNQTTIIEGSALPPVDNIQLSVRAAMNNPIGSIHLSELARGKNSAVIVINDITRPYPVRELVTECLKDLREAGMKESEVIILVATGNHRPATPVELEAMLGLDLAQRLCIVNHDCMDEADMVYLGTTPRYVPVYVNKVLAGAEVKVLTGLIAPHHAAGFSGGRKSVIPGVASLKTLNVHHSLPIRPSHPAMGWLEGNAFHEEALAGARMAKIDFIVNTVNDAENRVVAVVAGDLAEAHYEGVRLSKPLWEKETATADIVVTSPGGYPRDIDLHQAQKALSVAELVCRPGGTMILVAEAAGGIGKFSSWLEQASTPEEVVERFKKEGYTQEASAKAYYYAKALTKWQISLVNGTQPKEKLEAMFLQHFEDLQSALDEALTRYGPTARVAVIPYALSVIPNVKAE